LDFQDERCLQQEAGFNNDEEMTATYDSQATTVHQFALGLPSSMVETVQISAEYKKTNLALFWGQKVP
jgi:hypothetical protein